ncbi:MAG TPA: hypothetical protein GXX58_04530 [Gelria sp.]|nr:hypothetical protein [Gelria sp.]
MTKPLRFTGVIEDMGEVIFKGPAPGKQSIITLKIKPRQILHQLNRGDDIAVDGVCLTIKEIDHEGFTVQLWPVTQEKTTLIHLDYGNLVNLERKG